MNQFKISKAYCFADFFILGFVVENDVSFFIIQRNYILKI